MEKILMASGVLTSIILTLVGLIKLPITKFKNKSWYSPFLTLLTLGVTFGVCTLCQLFILELPFVDWSFGILCITTLATVMLSYNGIYEGLNIKDGVHNLLAKWKELRKLSPEAKAVNKIDNVVKKLGLSAEAFANVVSQVTIKEEKKTE